MKTKTKVVKKKAVSVQGTATTKNPVGDMDILQAPSTTGQKLTTIKIAPIAVNFGREDLNQLAHKINEIISFVNK